MSDEQKPQENQEAPDAQQQAAPGQRTIRLADEGVRAVYSNVFSLLADQDAIMLLFGSQFGNPNVVKIESKIALSPRNAKRLGLSLAEVIRRYEARNGIIDVSAPPPQQQPGQQPGGGSDRTN